MESLIDRIDMLSGAVIQENAPILTQSEFTDAAEKLIQPTWRAIVRVKHDPAPHAQDFGLFSFTPAQGATPNQHGIFGTAKLRGNFPNEEQAASEAERIIRDVDSVNEIYTVRVGQTFPLTKEPRFVEHFDTVDLSKETTEIEKQEKVSKIKQEKAEKKKLVDRERQLLQEHKQILDGTYEEDPIDVYIRAHVKRSQLQYTLEMTEKKIQDEILPALNRAKDEIAAWDETDSTLRQQYLDRYLEARKDAGLETEFNTNSGTQLDFMKYLLEDEHKA
jgi:Family of unknown function (DUF5832)